MTRRHFLSLSSAVLNAQSDGKLRGIFPILQTPYTSAGKVDFAVLVWPQRASQYQSLSFEERIEGAERVVAAGKGKKPAVVIGVQGSDASTAMKYAKHASKIRPDAIIALPT